MTDLHIYRRGSLLAILLLLAIILIAKSMAFSVWSRNDEPVSEELARFVTEKDSMEGAVSVEQCAAVKTTVLQEATVPHAFDPNTADSVELVSLGLRPYVARNIIRYREKGGVFRKSSDMARIYGMEEEQFDLLEPYIKIAPARDVVGQPIQTASILAQRSEVAVGHGPKPMNDDAQTSEIASVAKEMQRVELNTADSVTLVAVRGIGPYTARKIMAYRKSLGGFVAVEQLDEIEGLRPENLENLKTMAYADSTLVKHVSINTSSLKHLQHHPYISYPQAKAIVELRTHRCQPINLNDLTTLEEFTSADLLRLKHYICE